MYIYIHIYIYLCTVIYIRSYNGRPGIIRIPSNDCHDSNVDCRDDVGGREVVIIITTEIFLNHHALLINGLQGFPQLRYFLIFSVCPDTH